MHIQYLADPRLRPDQQTPFPAFTVSLLRLWDNVGWSTLEPQRDVYDWTRMDGTIQKATANGVGDFIFTFGYVPQWASSNPGDACHGACDPPAHLSDLDNFANALVRRYCGVVRYYETWNEPSGSAYWNGTNQQFLTITQHIYSAVKSTANCGCANGTCSPGGGSSPNKVLLPPIGSPAYSQDRQWLQSWLNYAGNPYPYADIATFHGYGYLANPEDIHKGADATEAILSRYGLGSAELWNTEASWGDARLTPDEQASWLMRYQIVQSFSGVSRFAWYSYDSCEWGTLWGLPTCNPTIDPPGLHQGGAAYSTVQQWLLGATPDSCNAYADGTWLCKLTRPGGYLAWAAWNSKGDLITLDASVLRGLTQYRDWQNHKTPITGGVEIGALPVLLESGDGF